MICFSMLSVIIFQYMSEITKFTCQLHLCVCVCVYVWTISRSLTKVIFKSLVIYRHTSLLWYFCKNVPAKSASFSKRFMEKTLANILITLGSMTLNWVRISKTLMEKWLINKAANPNWSKTRSNYITVNELMKMIIIFMTSFKTLLVL